MEIPSLSKKRPSMITQITIRLTLSEFYYTGDAELSHVFVESSRCFHIFLIFILFILQNMISLFFACLHTVGESSTQMVRFLPDVR